MKKQATQEANRWLDMLSRVKAASAELEASATHYFEPWYRGSPHGSYSLQPSLFRGYPTPKKKHDKTWSHIWHQEQDLYWEFATRARQLHGHVDDDWDILFTMRHYGVPTRVLDWTETLGVAIYMALHDFGSGMPTPKVPSAKDPPCIWVLNPYELNWRSTGGTVSDIFDPKNLGWDVDEQTYYGYSELLLEGGMDWDGPRAVYPRQRSDRMQAQRGWFTVHGDDFTPIDQRKSHRQYLRKVEIPKSAASSAFEFLKTAGLELFVLFPDLPSLAEHLRRQHASERQAFLES